MNVLNLTNPAFGLGQTFTRYLEPLLNSPRKPGLGKIANAFRAEMERRAGKTIVKSMPFILHFEPTNLCNLKCPTCYTAKGWSATPRGSVSFGDYRKVIDELKGALVLVRLDGLGESFLNPDLFSMIRYTARSGIASAISTNLTTFKPGDCEKVVDAGLDYLIISLDGATKETYEKIRVGADFERVISTVKEMVAAKKARKRRTPFIEIQFILFEENAHEAKRVEKLARSLGIDRVLFKEAREGRLRETREKSAETKPCYWLWYVMNVVWTGDLKACCTSGLASAYSFGNIIKNPVRTEWNNAAMQASRRLFTAEADRNAQSLAGCKCLTCYKLNK